MLILQLLSTPMFWVFALFIAPLGFILWCYVIGSVYSGLGRISEKRNAVPRGD